MASVLNLVKDVSSDEINRIASQARNTFNISSEIRILKRKAFKNVVGDPQRGGTYNYFQDCVFINRSVVRSYRTLHLKWVIFHEFGHAYFARIFAKHGFLPFILYDPTIEDEIVEHGIRHLWNGLCDYFVNEFISIKLGLKKFDSTLEQTVDKLSNELASGMCFHLYDYWKHGRNGKIAQKAKNKIPPKILNLLERQLSVIPLDDPIDRMVRLLDTIVREFFQVKIQCQTISKKAIEKNSKATLPKFWGGENINLKVLVVFGWQL